MKMHSATFIGLLIVAGCGDSSPVETRRTDNIRYDVERLFTVDGCSVYRFRDAGSNRYFSSCSGSTTWTERHGKTSADIEIPTFIRHF